MSWLIERDDAGKPLRMWWTGPSDPDSIDKKRREELLKNSLPMPAMREWAKARGLTT